MGPVPADQLRRMLADGHLPTTTLVWREGMDGWAPAESREEFSVSTTWPPPVPLGSPDKRAGIPNAGAHWTDRVLNEDGLDEVHPWRRWLARNLEMFYFVCAIAIVAGAVNPRLITAAGGDGGYRFAFVVMPLWLPVEAAFLSAIGTTPGKALFNIRVVQLNNQRLSYSAALVRALEAWFFGMGTGFPIVALFTQAAAQKRLTTRRVTSWDEGRHRVVHGPVGPLRIMGIIALILLAMALVGASA